MTCYRPLVRIEDKKTGIVRVIKFSEYEQRGLMSSFEHKNVLKVDVIPCGSCFGCKMKKSRDWSIRCYHEFITYNYIGCFLTLTIDDLLVSRYYDRIEKQNEKRIKRGLEKIEYKDINCSLDKQLIAVFLKDLRNYLTSVGVTFRYFIGSEYGAINNRPHYHMLLFGYDFPDKEILRASKKGFDMYISEELSSLWKYGFSTIENLSLENCFYSAQYTYSKKNRFFSPEQEYEHYYGREKEFLRSSRGSCRITNCKHYFEIIKNYEDEFSHHKLDKIPYCKNCEKIRGGLGYRYFLEHLDNIVSQGFIVINGIKFPIPDYYKDLVRLQNPSLYDKLKYRNNEILENISVLERTTERLKVRENVIKSKYGLNVRDFD